jgi:hypothetical protein
MGTIIADVMHSDSEAELRGTLAVAGRACCCPAKPVAVAIMPPTASRPHATDLLLCGHHYRACRDGLAVAGAAVLDSRPYPELG